ncbi:MAG: hypothetical protein PWQ89_1442 [Verrucomicrobiota bacterium]|jgi:hypothetical protein|nr:hypothetical protein [Verrucomicrobiota bacterium]
MEPKVKDLLEEYAELERGVQELISAQCRDACELCTACCCRADICEEALLSPFLRALHGRKELESDRYGFLTETGCVLEIGRPPICYEFFCSESLVAQPDDLHRDLLRILGRLPTHAGENASGDVHLVEILHEEQLEKAAFQRVKKQLQEAVEALNGIRIFFNEGTLSEQAGRVLRKITVLAND